MPEPQYDGAMNYDETDQAQRYDAARAMPAGLQRLWIAPIRDHLRRKPRLVIDLACGTGRFTASLADELGSPVLGVDPAKTMLAKARANVCLPSVRFVEGGSEAIPAGDGSADVVFVSMAWHHFPDRKAAAREIRRVLAPGGIAAIRSPMRDTIDRVVYHAYFPISRELNTQRLPARADLVADMAGAGMAEVLHTPIELEMATSWEAYCDKIAARAYSDLAVTPDEDFARGLEAMRSVRVPPGPVKEPIALCLFRREA